MQFIVACVLFWLAVGFFFQSAAAYPETRIVDRRRPTMHRWLSNRLKPRKMHWGPRRLW